MINNQCKYTFNHTPHTLPINGYIDLLNYGGFFTYFYGTYILNSCQYNFQSNVLCIGQRSRVIIPQNAINIVIRVMVEVSLFSWNVVFNDLFEKSDEICLLTYGLCFMPFCKQIPCTGPGFIGC